MDLLQDIEVKGILKKTHRRIVEELEKSGVLSEKQLIERIGISRRTIIENLKELEKTRIVLSNRSSSKLVWLNPAFKRWGELAKFNKQLLLEYVALLDKIEAMKKKAISRG